MRRDRLEGRVGDQPLGRQIVTFAGGKGDLDAGRFGDARAAVRPGDHPVYFERNEVSSDGRG